MEFRPGDRVVAINAYGPVKAGDTGEYVHTHRDHPRYGVRWDKKNSRMHTCSGHCEKGNGWYVPEGYLRLEDIPDLGELPSADAKKIDCLFNI